MRIIPAIDILDGKCVRLSQGDFASKQIYDEPLNAARSFEASGLRYLHLVDLDGARAGKIVNWPSIEEILAGTNLQVDFGGGIKTREDIVRLFEAGVSMVNVGSVAAREPAKMREWIREFGPERIILSADVRNRVVSVAGWQQETSLTVDELIGMHLPNGLRYVTCTDITVDGTLAGVNLSFYRQLRENFPQLLLIASGGIASMKDIESLGEIGVAGAIIGKAIYEGSIQLGELSSMVNRDSLNRKP